MMTVDAKKLLRAISNLRIAGKRNDDCSVTVSGDESDLLLDASVNHLRIKQYISATGDGLPTTGMTLQTLYDAVRKETGSSITFQHNGITIGANAISPDTFENLFLPRTIQMQRIVSLDAHLLVKNLRSIMYARPPYIIEGIMGAPICMESDIDGFHLYASFSHRLACVTHGQSQPNYIKGFLPGAACEALLKLATDGTVTCDIDDENILHVGGYGWEITVQMRWERDSGWRNQIPAPSPFGITFHRKSMLNTLKKAIPTSSQMGNKILFRRHNDGLRITVGTEHILFERADTSQMTTFMCDASHLIEILNACQEDWVTLETARAFLSERAPAVIRDGHAFHLLTTTHQRLGNNEELCPFCGERFIPEECDDLNLQWKAAACSPECAQQLGSCGKGRYGNHIESHPRTALKNHA